jgi:hypothetical protein
VCEPVLGLVCTSPRRRGLRQRLVQVLERFVVEIAGDPAALHLSDLDQPLLGVRGLDRRGEHVRDRLYEVDVRGGERAGPCAERRERAEQRVPALDDDADGADRAR